MQTTIKRTGLGHGEYGTCRYIGDDEKQAHNLTQLRQRYANDSAKLAYINQHDTKRNIALAGVGVRTCGWKYTAHDFQQLSRLKLHNKVKTINIVISPQRGTVDPHNLEQVEQFKRFCINYGKTVFPHHKIYIAIQHDNKGGKKSRGGITHAHLIVSSLSTLSPHNALQGWQYDNHHLRHEYNILAGKFNRKQNSIRLGQAVYTKYQRAPKPSATEDWLVQRSQKPLDELEAGKLHNKTAVKRAFHNQGIMAKFSQHRHREHLTDSNGNLVYKTDKNGHKHMIPMYRKYTSGKRKGQYMYRINKHGNKSKIPLYSYSAGLTLKPIKSDDTRSKRKRRYIKGSRLQRISGDPRFSGKLIMTTLYKIKKGRYHVPTKFRQRPTAQSSASTSNIASKTAEAQPSSSVPTQSEMASEALQQRIMSVADNDEPEPSFTPSSVSSSASSSDISKSSESASSVQNEADKEARETQRQQRLVAIQRKHNRDKKRTKAQRQQRQRKEKTKNERRFAEQFKEMAENNQRQRQRLVYSSERARPTSRQSATASGRPKEEQPGRRQQGNASTITSIISSINKAIKGVKKFRFRRLEHQVAKGIHERINRLYRKARQRVERIRNRIAQRRQAKHDKDVARKRHERWEREQGRGFE